MTRLILWIFGLTSVTLLLLNPSTIGGVTDSNLFSTSSIYINFILLFICTSHILLNFTQSRKLGVLTSQIIFLPSTLLPLVTIILYCIPITWSILDKKYVIDLVYKNYIDKTILLIATSSLLLLAGITFSKYKMLAKLSNKFAQRRLHQRKLDYLLLNSKNRSTLIIFLIILSILVAPFQIGLRTDVIVEGGRGFSVDVILLQILIPLAGILSTIFTILAGVYYSYLGKKILFIIPLIDLLARLVVLSRGFFLPLIFFVCSSALLGKKFPSLVYFSIIPCSFLLGATALTARGLSSGGISGLVSGFSQTQTDVLSVVRIFFEVNTNIGILTNAVAFHNPSQNFVDGLIAWIVTILPIPTFLNLTSKNIPDVATILNITNVGIPMPVVGELYFQMGWLGLSVFFALGWWLGRLEANVIFHTKVYGRAYWPHVLIWMSLLYGYIFSFHSASRGSSRVLFYSLSLIWLLEILIVPKEKNC